MCLFLKNGFLFWNYATHAYVKSRPTDSKSIVSYCLNMENEQPSGWRAEGAKNEPKFSLSSERNLKDDQEYELKFHLVEKDGLSVIFYPLQLCHDFSARKSLRIGNTKQQTKSGFDFILILSQKLCLEHSYTS